MCCVQYCIVSVDGCIVNRTSDNCESIPVICQIWRVSHTHLWECYAVGH